MLAVQGAINCSFNVVDARLIITVLLFSFLGRITEGEKTKGFMFPPASSVVSCNQQPFLPLL